jgi:hypothetical protein
LIEIKYAVPAVILFPKILYALISLKTKKADLDLFIFLRPKVPIFYSWLTKTEVEFLSQDLFLPRIAGRLTCTVIPIPEPGELGPLSLFLALFVFFGYLFLPRALIT